jgi:hypothetical protein
VLVIDDVKFIFVPVPLQMLIVAGLVTFGEGLTVTVIVYDVPTQEPVVDVAITLYCTVPAAVLLGLVNVWFILLPLPPLVPVIAPVIVPIVHVKLLGTLELKLIFVPVPLQMLIVAGFVTAGVGFTVTVIVKGEPGHEPVEEVGVTIYWTVPAVLLLGLVNTWLIELPEPELAPVMPPVIVPVDQIKLLGALEVKLIFVLAPLHILTVGEFVTAVDGFTVTVIVYGKPAQKPTEEVGVIIYWTVPDAELLGSTSVWFKGLPVPELAPVIPPVIVPTDHE